MLTDSIDFTDRTPKRTGFHPPNTVKVFSFFSLNREMPNR